MTKKNVRLSIFERASGVLMRERRKLSQSRQKKAKSAIDVPKCMTTR